MNQTDMADENNAQGSKMRRTLIVAHFFPPQGGAGVQRTLKFVKYLSEFGWQPVVLTVRSTSTLQDPSLLREIPDSALIYRTPALQLPALLPWRIRQWLTRWLLIVDGQLGWLPFAVSTGRRIIREQNIATIYTTSAPYTDHLIGLCLKRQTGLPWFADFRDPWADNFAAHYATVWHERKVHNLERQVFSSADRIGVTADRQREFYCCKYGERIGAKVLTITNGYDPTDSIEPTTQVARDTSTFTLTYMGSLYGTRTASPFIKGLHQAIQDGSLPRERVKVHFVGNTGQEIEKILAKTGLGSIVIRSRYVPHQEVMAHLSAADVLLLIQSTDSELTIPAKVFEYLATHRPILALIPPGATADILANIGGSMIIAPDDVAGIAKSLGQLYKAWGTKTLESSVKPEMLRAYERRSLTRTLAQVLDEMMRI